MHIQIVKARIYSPKTWLNSIRSSLDQTTYNLYRLALVGAKDGRAKLVKKRIPNLGITSFIFWVIQHNSYKHKKKHTNIYFH